MSARYSKTSSRGRATVAVTVTGSKARRSLRRAPHPQHRVPGLAAAHDMDLGRLLRPQRATQLAHRPAARVHEHPLADQRGAMAVATAVATGFETEHAVAQEGALELGGGSGFTFGHGDLFRFPSGASCTVQRPFRDSGLWARSATQDRLTSSLSSRSTGRPRRPAGPGGRDRMDAMTSGTLAGTGSFRCLDCDYVVTLAADDRLPTCPGCDGERFARASLFGDPRLAAAPLPAAADVSSGTWAADARDAIAEPGQYLAFRDD